MTKSRLLLMVLVSMALASQLSAQPAVRPAVEETLDVGDEPGRISTDEVVIADGPFARQVVFFRSSEAPGTLIVHTSERFVYLVQGNNRALRYGIGVGREGFQWSGLVKVSRKAEWPDWRPPPEMIRQRRRRPEGS